MTVANVARTSALSTKAAWSDVAVKAAQNLSETQRLKLRNEGVLDIKRPITIKAEALGASAELSIRENSAEETGTDFKIIHFQRHGQGYHNLLGDMWRELGKSIDIDDPNPKTNPFVRPEIVDSPLTEAGREQSEMHRMEASLLNPEVVIVSPLQRAIQTALISFSDHRDQVPWVAHEGCREDLGLLTCNKRRPLSEIQADFPKIDFSHCDSGDEDTLWDPTELESALNKSERAYKFLTEFVRTRPEKEIAVIGHSAWLFNLCNAVMDCGDDQSLMNWFLTSEIRSMRISFSEDQ